MSPSFQIRSGWVFTFAALAVAVLLQTLVEALWFYQPRPFKGGFTKEMMIIWPTVILLLLPFVAGIVMIFHGYYRRMQARGDSNAAAS